MMMATAARAALATMTSITTKHWGKVAKLTSTAKAPFDIHRIFVKDDGTFPNNEEYSTLLYKAAFMPSNQAGAAAANNNNNDIIEAEGRRRITKDGNWTSPWVWGIFDYHHYHSKAWELLLCIRGSAYVQVGGNEGPTVSVAEGDLMLIPPGMAHKQLDEKNGFSLLGSYPTKGFDDGSSMIDTITGSPTEKERARIAGCYVPERDPICGLDIRELCNAP